MKKCVSKTLLAFVIICIVISNFTLSIYADEGDNGYLMDFEQIETGTVGVPHFDNDFGQVAKREVQIENGNKFLYLERNLTNNDTGAWIQRTLPSTVDNNDGFTFELSVKQTSSLKKWVNIYSSEGIALMFEFGLANTGKINGIEVPLTGNTDGQFHHYKFYVTSEGKITFSMDGIVADGTYQLKNLSAPNRFRITAGKSTEVGNGMYVDNILLCSNSNPIPSMPEFEIERNGFTSIYAEDGCTVYYTFDGSYPTSASECYIEPIYVPDGNYLRAVAVKNETMQVSACAINGPYPVEYIETPIVPSNSGKMYLMDFENLSEGSLGTGLGIFDNDWGMRESADIISENGNLAAHLKKHLDASPTAAWIQHTFSEDKIISEELCFEFSLKQNSNRAKWVNLYNSENNQFLSFEFGNKDVGKINGTEVELLNNTDGEYHHYKFLINDSGIQFWYDNVKIEGNFAAKSTIELKRFRFSAGGQETEGEMNSFTLDNICAYEPLDSIPSMPVVNIRPGVYDYNTEITLTADSDCTIYYTTDGTYPILTSDFIYNESLRLNTNNFVVRAVAVRENGNISACAYYGPFQPENKNGLVVITSNPYNSSDPAKITGANMNIVCIEESININLILCLYEDGKLIKDAIKIKPYVLSYGENSVGLTIDKKENADMAILYIWSENNSEFAPLTNMWKLTKSN